MEIDLGPYYNILTQGLMMNFGSGCLPDLVKEAVEEWKCFDNCKTILDIGCGNGYWTKYLRNKGFDVIGCDIDNKLFNETVITDIHNLCFNDKQFDGIFCNGTFEHSIAPFIAMCEMNRVLKLYGILMINFPHEENNIMIPLPQHINILSLKVFAELANKSGFKIDNCIVMNDTNNGNHYIFKLIKISNIYDKLKGDIK